MVFKTKSLSVLAKGVTYVNKWFWKLYVYEKFPILLVKINELTK